MIDKSSLVFGFLAPFFLLVPSPAVERVKDPCVTKIVDTFLHARDRVARPDNNSIYFLVVVTESKKSVLLWQKILSLKTVLW